VTHVEAVVFDLGGVLIDWDPRHLYRQLFPDDEPAMEAFLASVCTPAWNAELDRGRPFAEAVAELVDAYPGQAPLIEAYRSRWTEMVRGAFDDTVELLADLRAAGVPLYALSNWSPETVPLVRHRFAFLDWFDGIVLSGEEGVVKPEPAIFDVLCRRYGLRPPSTVFVDDSPANVAGAAAVGFVALRFTSAPTLREQLVGLGVLS
jgi:2-haloacid dehalogenase